MTLLAWCSLLLLSASAFAASKTTPLVARNNGGNGGVRPENFVTQTPDGKLTVNGSEFHFLGTTAYWLPSLNNDEDIDFTLGNISQAGINVVRVWGFNDVETVPENGTWFQAIQNGTLVINNGTNGLQRLDRVVESARNRGIYVQISFTNNWNPRLIDNITAEFNATRPRGFLGNDYGGMDFYVRAFSGPQDHDQFYTNETILEAFRNYTTAVISRYADNPAVLSWELANDPRCGSTINASTSCNTQTITKWHADMADHVKSQDPNHLVSSGHHGQLCPTCPKLFPRVVPPGPAPSPAPGARRNVFPLTRERILKERKEALKKTRYLAKRASSRDGVQIRGRWVPTPTRRQSTNELGPAFDGSSGVDSEDISNIPAIGFSSMSLFPDQDVIGGSSDPNLSSFNNTLAQGLEWIRQHAEIGRLSGKPVVMNGFGLVTQTNAQAFVPFNSTVAPFAPDANASAPSGGQEQAPFGVTDEQRNQAYNEWLSAGVREGLAGMIQYQWSQTGLSAQQGTLIQPVNNETNTTPLSTNVGVSPNDGYGIQDVGRDPVIQTIQEIGQDFIPT